MGKPLPDASPSYEEPPPYISVQPRSSSNVVVVDSAPELDRKSVTLMCPGCHILVATRIEPKSTIKTHICALACAMICCWPLVCIAYCGGIFYTITHYCPNCDIVIGVYEIKCCNRKGNA